MKKQVRKDCVTEHDGGWHGASGSTDPEDPPKRLFRTKEEAQALDSLLMISNEKKKPTA